MRIDTEFIRLGNDTAEAAARDADNRVPARAGMGSARATWHLPGAGKPWPVHSIDTGNPLASELLTMQVDRVLPIIEDAAEPFSGERDTCIFADVAISGSPSNEVC